MNEYKFTVTIDCESQAEADRVIQERVGFDEDYGFDYTLDWSEIKTPELKQGDFVLYDGKPRTVYKFMPFGPTKECPAVVRDPRFDMVELVELKRPVYVNQVQRMMIEEKPGS